MKAIMTFKEMELYVLQDVVSKKLTRLTKWLPASHEEFSFIEKEQRRILEDSTRECVAVYNEGHIALFVNDLTDGEFDKLPEE